MTPLARIARVGIGSLSFLFWVAYLPAQTRQPSLDLSMNNPDFQSPALCEVSCFAGTYSFGTVPYFSLDQPRNVTLVYNGDQANPRPFIYADVHGNSSVAVTRYTMRAYIGTTAVTFLNGQTVLTFTGSQPSTPVRLGGQFDARSYATNVYSLGVTVQATYADGLTGEASFGTHIMIINEAGSQIAKGWTVVGHQRLKETAALGYMITNGDGSATWFEALHAIAADFTTLTWDPPSATYTRTYPDGSRAFFNASGQHTSTVAQSGHATAYRYHPDGRLKYITDPFRAQPHGPLTSIGLSYDANGLNFIQEPSLDGTQWAGRQTRFVVNSSRCLTSAQDPDGVSTFFTCDSNGRLATIKDRRAQTTTLVYNSSSWKLSQVTLPSVPVDAGGGTTTNKNPLIKFSPWQTKGVPTSTTSSSSPWTAPTVSGVVGTVTDPAGRITVMKANRFGQAIDITEPHGRRTIIASSFGFLPRKIIRPDGAFDSLAYDSYGRLTKSHPAGEYHTLYSYTSGGQLHTIGGPGARPQTRTYIGNRLDQISFGGNPAQTLNYSYDPATQRVASVRDNSGHTTTYSYDPRFGNLQQQTIPGDRTMTKVFDAVGRDSVTTVPELAPRTAIYDVMNRLKSTSASGSTVTLSYNQLFNTDVTDANGNHYHTDYNALGWPTNECDASNRCSTIRYDASGTVTSTTNRRNQRLTFTRDSLARLTSQSGAGTVSNSYSYSANGRSMVAWNAIQRDSIFINPGDQTLAATDSVVTWIDGKRFRVSHRQSRAVEDTVVTTITSNTGVTFLSRSALYSQSGFLDTLWIGSNRNPVSVHATVSFAPDADGTGGTYAMPGNGTRIIHPLAIHSTGRVEFSSSSLNQSFLRSYFYDQAGRIQSMMVGNSYQDKASFQYDPLGRLIRASRHSDCITRLATTDSISGVSYSCFNTTSSDDFAYDAMGNRADRGGIATTGNRYTAFNGATYSYDLDGNVIQKNKAGVYDRKYYWNSAGQLDSAIKNSGLRNSYDYNALGKPVRIWDGDANGRQISRYLLWDGEVLIAEFWPNGQRDIDYIYLPGTIDRPFASTHGLTTPTTIRYQQLDELGNVLGTHQNGTITQSNSYDAWGTLTSSNADSHLHWKGLFWNGDVTGLYYMRNRWYDPEGGRFVNEDPAGFAGGINLYAFAGNDPVNRRDPLGLAHQGDGCRWVEGSGPNAPTPQGWLTTVTVHAGHWECEDDPRAYNTVNGRRDPNCPPGGNCSGWLPPGTGWPSQPDVTRVSSQAARAAAAARRQCYASTALRTTGAFGAAGVAVGGTWGAATYGVVWANRLSVGLGAVGGIMGGLTGASVGFYTGRAAGFAYGSYLGARQAGDAMRVPSIAAGAATAAIKCR